MHAIRETVVWETTSPLQPCRFFLETALNIQYTIQSNKSLL